METLQENLRRRIAGKYAICPSGCWEWTASRNHAGYGQLNVNGVPMNASRASYIAFKGDAPKEIDVCHTCDNRPCINPSHLFLGTRQENILDAAAKGRLPRGEARSNSRLRTEDILVIRGLAKAAVTQRVIASLFGMSVGHVNQIIHRRMWAHVA